MEKPVISKDILYIGADDTDLDLFEGQYIIPEGISYNSYVILDEQVAIMDTIDARKTDEWLKSLAEALDGRQPDYLIASHMEPDHAANIKRVVELYPAVKVVCTAKTVQLIARFFSLTLPPERLMVVKEGDTLRLGAHTLRFIMAPMVHWPEVMMEYEESEKILFSADAFGKFGALSYDDPEGWTCEGRRYYFNIVGKYGAQVQSLLKKTASLDIKTICPLHGPILTENLGYYVGLYDTWSAYRPEEPGIFIAYCSLHGNTEEAALKLASIIRNDSDVKVSVSDLRRDDMAEAIEDAFRYDRLVLCAPTYDGGVMPVMADFIHHLAIKNYQKRKVALVENGSWAPAAAKVMKESLATMKAIELVEPVVTIESTMKAATVEQLKVLAQALISE